MHEEFEGNRFPETLLAFLLFFKVDLTKEIYPRMVHIPNLAVYVLQWSLKPTVMSNKGIKSDVGLE